jgi:hypothetical protein
MKKRSKATARNSDARHGTNSRPADATFLTADDLNKAPATNSGMMKWRHRAPADIHGLSTFFVAAPVDGAAGGSQGQDKPKPPSGCSLFLKATNSVKIVSSKPKDARTVSDLNWEGSTAVAAVSSSSRRSSVLEDPRVMGEEEPGRRGARTTRTQIGPFYSYGYIPEKQQTMLRDLKDHFATEEDLRALADMINETSVPLKIYDWFVSRYAQDFRISREVTMQDGTQAILDVHNAYRSDRWAVRKRHWDFLCKRIKVAFNVDGKDWVTSVTQLNACVFVKRFRLKELILQNMAAVVEHYEKGKRDSEEAAQKAARQAAIEAGVSLDVPLKRKRGRRRKPKEAALTPVNDPILLSECSVKTKLSLQD